MKFCVIIVNYVHCYLHVEKVSSLNATLDSECANALEGLLTKVGAILPEPSQQYTTADCQGVYMYLLCMYIIMLPSEERL